MRSVSCSAALFTVTVSLVSCSSSDASHEFLAVGAGDGPLIAVETIDTVESVQSVHVVDIEGDGDVDLVVSGNDLDVLRNNGAGEFVRVANAPFTEPAACLAVEVGDINGDGQLDLAVAEHHEGPYVFLYLATADGSFRHAPHSPLTLDAEPHLHTLALHDFDGDGHLDLLSDSWPEDRLVLARGHGDGTFATPGAQFDVPPTPIINVDAGDMNGDGALDVVAVAHESQGVSVLLGDGRGGFALRDGAPFPSFGGFSTLALADLDGDGDLDVAEVHRSDSSTQYKQDALSILLNDGTGALAHAPRSPFNDLVGRAINLAVGDVNGDARLDVVTLSEETRAVSTFLGGADGFTFAGSNGIGARPVDVAVADTDGDGRAEVFVACHRDGTLRCFEFRVE